jgi:hypothetical protein
MTVGRSFLRALVLASLIVGGNDCLGQRIDRLVLNRREEHKRRSIIGADAGEGRRRRI